MTNPEVVPLTDAMATDAGVLVQHLRVVFGRALGQRRGLVPSAAAVTTSGEVVMIAVDAGDGADVPVVIEHLAALLAESRGDWRSACVGFAVTDADGCDLIEVHVDFADSSTALVAAIPFESGGLWAEPSIGVASWRSLPKFVWTVPAMSNEG